jgi:hypothetical protein
MLTVYTPQRECGWREEGGCYIVGGTDGSPDGCSARFTVLNPPVPYQVPHHRGPRLVNGDAILERRDMEAWWVGSSAETEARKRGDAWALDTFGMTEARRLSVGDCRGCKSIDEALAVIAGRIAYSQQLNHQYRELTILKVGELPRVAGHCDALRTHLVNYEETNSVGSLVQAHAAVWRIANTIPPRKRQEVYPVLMRMMAIFNMPLDATTLFQSKAGVNPKRREEDGTRKVR